MECVNCEESFSYVGQHYRQSNCSYPELSDDQREVLIGVLMGDGSIPEDGENHLRFYVEMNNKEFLNWLHSEISEFSLGVKETSSGTYRLGTIRCPAFREMRDGWYNEDKRYPNNLDLTPTVLRMWYVTDGHFNETSGRPRITIGCKNEFDRQEYLSNLFKFADPSFYSNGLWLSADETEQAFEYMGNHPVAGFEHKWRGTNV